jgi:hypothetical protein
VVPRDGVREGPRRLAPAAASLPHEGEDPRGALHPDRTRDAGRARLGARGQGPARRASAHRAPRRVALERLLLRQRGREARRLRDRPGTSVGRGRGRRDPQGQVRVHGPGADPGPLVRPPRRPVLRGGGPRRAAPRPRAVHGQQQALRPPRGARREPRPDQEEGRRAVAGAPRRPPAGARARAGEPLRLGEGLRRGLAARARGTTWTPRRGPSPSLGLGCTALGAGSTRHPRRAPPTTAAALRALGLPNRTGDAARGPHLAQRRGPLVDTPSELFLVRDGEARRGHALREP